MRVIYCSNMVYSNAVHEINMSSNICHVYFLRLSSIYIMKARKSVESLQQNLAETIAQSVDEINLFFT